MFGLDSMTRGLGQGPGTVGEGGGRDGHAVGAELLGARHDGRAFQQTAVRAMMEAKGNSGPSAATSIMKNAGTRWMQDKAELTLEIMGHQGLGWEGDAFTAEELAAVRGWLGGKATTIYGGSQEVQNNIISKRILGLPDLTQNN